MTPTTVRDKFLEAFHGNQNFITPTVVRYGYRGKCLYELSKGTGMKGQPIYGVTVIDKDKNHLHDLSIGGISLDEAKEHIKNLPKT